MLTAAPPRSHPGLWARSRACALSSLEMVEASRHRVDACRRLLNPAFGFSGSSDAPLDGSLRERLVTGELILAERVCWAGSAAGYHSCAVCFGYIAKGQLEYDVDGWPGGMLHAHPPCYLLWLRESEAARVILASG